MSDCIRVLVTGAAGQVGGELLRTAPSRFKVIGMASDELNITDAAQVAEAVAKFEPDLIINAAAFTAVDRAESEIDHAWAVNSDGVANLAKAAQQLDIPVLHISTDYVFAGTSTEAYSEIDATGPTGVYGASKLSGEEELILHCQKHLILRTSWVFGANGNNFVKTMLRLGNSGRESLSVVADQYGCPTSASSIAQTLWELATKYVNTGDLEWGIYHFGGSPACTWHEFAIGIFNKAHQLGMLDKIPEVKKIATTDYPTPAKRPSWSVLNCTKLEMIFGIKQPDWHYDLDVMLHEIREK